LKAVVLAAGEGVRLQPLSLTRPKHLLPVAGKPLLQHLVEAVKTAGINEIFMVVRYKSEMIRNFFGNGEKFGVEIGYIQQGEEKGTAYAAMAVESYINEDFLLVYGDLLVESEVIRKVVEAHKREKPEATMAAVKVRNPQHYGILALQGNRVTGIIEKPRPEEAPTNLANAGVYVLSLTIFEKIRQTPRSERGEIEITDSLSLMINEGKTVLALTIPEESWVDIGRPWNLLEANEWKLKRLTHRIDGQIENGAIIIGPVTVENGAKIRAGAYIEGPAFIGAGSDVGPNCFIRPYTSLGKNVRIGNACEIKNSIIMDGTHVGHLSYVGDSIIGEKCNLGAGTVIANLRFNGKNVKMCVKDEVVDTGRRKLGIILGDHVETGINASFLPGVKVGNDCWIGPNVLVYRDVPPNTFLFLKQELEERKLKS
jgi:bifunctional UDP-N-acetylglucosamine pyrophosphorylase/glucosamine-1-phosphate N-acetyltransferase